MFAASRTGLNVIKTKAVGNSAIISTARMISGQRLRYSLSTKINSFSPVVKKTMQQSTLFSNTQHIHRFHSSAISNAKVPFLLADIGEGITECEVIQWFVKVGDKVDEFDRLCEVQSDKASVEITSRFTGTIASLKYSVGDMAKVGTPLVEIEVAGENTPSSANSTDDLVPDTSAPPTPAVVAKDVAASAPVASEVPEHIQTFAAPAVRRIAKENNIDIKSIRGTGKGGRVMKEDILNFIANGGQNAAAAPAAPAPAAAAPTPAAPKVHIPVGEDKVVPLTMIQKAMFKQMTKSLSIPHFGYADEIVLDNATAFRASLNDYVSKNSSQFSFKKVSYMPIFIKALSVALEQYPIMNACVVDGENPTTAKLKYRASHNIGIAMDTPNGLIVPNIKNVQNLSVLDIAAELNRLQEAGKKNSLAAADLRDGTVSLSNVGMIGGTYLNPVVVTSEVAIAAIGKMQRLPRFKMIEQPDGRLTEQVVAQQIVNISWSADHRVVDGATIARFSEAWKAVVENPYLLGAKLR
ncbi:hypothetical protein BGZ73_008864 [Actinomortierella ambigua]|nr:hypothetical protein BGZ73_008864 [Actinomortierella ambigua]